MPKFIDLSAKGAAAAPMGEWISTNHNQIFKELSDVKVSIILASAQSTVSTGASDLLLLYPCLLLFTPDCIIRCSLHLTFAIAASLILLSILCVRRYV